MKSYSLDTHGKYKAVDDLRVQPLERRDGFSSPNASASFLPPHRDCGKCGIEAPGGVQLIYWQPDTVSNQLGTLAEHDIPNTQVQDGFTFTSPSVYVVYSSLRATFTCASSVLETTGSSFDVKTIGYPSKFLAYGTLEMPDSGCTEHVVAGGWHTIDFDYIFYNPITTTKFQKPGCTPEANPRLSLPAELTSVDPSWASCEPLFYGAFDPPRILKKASGELAPPSTIQPPPTRAGPHLISSVPPVAQATPAPTTPIPTAAEKDVTSQASPAFTASKMDGFLPGSLQRLATSAHNVALSVSFQLSSIPFAHLGTPVNGALASIDPGQSTSQNSPMHSITNDTPTVPSPVLTASSPVRSSRQEAERSRLDGVSPAASENQSTAQDATKQPTIQSSPAKHAAHSEDGLNSNPIDTDDGLDPIYVDPTNDDLIGSDSASAVAPVAASTNSASKANAVHSKDTAPVLRAPLGPSDKDWESAAPSPRNSDHASVAESSSRMPGDPAMGASNPLITEEEDIRRKGKDPSVITDQAIESVSRVTAHNPLPTPSRIPTDFNIGNGDNTVQLSSDGELICATQSKQAEDQMTAASVDALSVGSSDKLPLTNTGHAVVRPTPTPLLIGGESVRRGPGGDLVVASQRIAPGSQTITSELQFSVGSSNLVLDGTTHVFSLRSTFAASPDSASPLIIIGHTAQPTPSGALSIAGQKIAADSRAGVSGCIVSVGASNVVIDGMTQALLPEIAITSRSESGESLEATGRQKAETLTSGATSESVGHKITCTAPSRRSLTEPTSIVSSFTSIRSLPTLIMATEARSDVSGGPCTAASAPPSNAPTCTSYTGPSGARESGAAAVIGAGRKSSSVALCRVLTFLVLHITKVLLV